MIFCESEISAMMPELGLPIIITLAQLATNRNAANGPLK
jgi:hypothetical protein